MNLTVPERAGSCGVAVVYGVAIPELSVRIGNVSGCDSRQRTGINYTTRVCLPVGVRRVFDERFWAEFEYGGQRVKRKRIISTLPDPGCDVNGIFSLLSTSNI